MIHLNPGLFKPSMSYVFRPKREANLLELLVIFSFDFPDVEVFFVYFVPIISGKRFTSAHMRSTDVS